MPFPAPVFEERYYRGQLCRFVRGGTHTPVRVVVHESGCASPSGAEGSLIKKGLGVHYSVFPDGRKIGTYNSVAEIVYHAGPLNTGSIGIECMHNVNGTDEHHRGKHVLIKCDWVWKRGNPQGLYPVPKLRALEATYWFCYHAAFTWGGWGKLDVPHRSTIGRRETLQRCQSYTVVCHGRLAAPAGQAHSDGWFQEAYISARSSGLGPAAALSAVLDLHGGVFDYNGVDPRTLFEGGD